MIIGVPKEIKNNENRVATIPAGVRAFSQAGHQVLVEKSAGLGSGIKDVEFSQAGGTVGTRAAKVAAGLGAKVTLLDISIKRLRYLDDVLPKNITLIVSNQHNIEEEIRDADAVIGAVLIPGAEAPKLVTEEMLKKMKPNSVIVDVAIDQGGCFEQVDQLLIVNQYIKSIMFYIIVLLICLEPLPGLLLLL